MIVNSTRQVDEGVKLVNATGEALGRIERYVEAINANVDSIATGANEQASSLSEVNRAVNQLDQATQENVELVSNVTNVATMMSTGAYKMKTLVELFKLNRRASIREPGAQPWGTVTENQRKRA